MSEIAAAFAAEGPLAASLEGYQPRAEQQRMADAVWTALEATDSLLVEAGTGTGKTFGYLVPALLWAAAGKRKIVVSTGTKHLQDQLYDRDLPQVRKALGVGVSTARLKGRANYLCWHRLELAETENLPAPEQSRVQTIKRWAAGSKTGDIAESGQAEDWKLWPTVTSTVDNCLGQDCPDYDRCFVSKARQDAQRAQLVVVNHHLLFADLVLRESGFAELLPSAEAIIVDEAHQFPETATQFFGQSVSSRQLLDLSADCLRELEEAGGGQPDLIIACNDLDDRVRELRSTLGTAGDRLQWRELEQREGFSSALIGLMNDLAILQRQLEAAAKRAAGLGQCLQRCARLYDRLEMLGDDRADQGQVRWAEVWPRSFSLQLSPLDVAEQLRQRAFNRQVAWIFTSATLAVGQNFSHFAERLGQAEAKQLQVDSPFDYANNALLYLPAGLPDPRERDYTDAVIAATRPALKASGGRAFLLFTSYRALNRAAELLQDLPFPLFVQGSSPRAQLLDEFRAAGNGVLLGTSAFWEGVDVRGEALSLVMIEKLPFASPNDPLLKARLDWLRQQGGNPFGDWQLPQAVIALKQGVGRLIRDTADRGVLILADPRLQRSSYGKTFLNSLPNMPRSDQIADVEAFFE